MQREPEKGSQRVESDQDWPSWTSLVWPDDGEKGGGPKTDIKCVERNVGPFDDKNGHAAEYWAPGPDADYRFWKPRQSRSDDLFVTFKIDHIRGQATDDYALVQLWFSSGAILLRAVVTVKIG